MTINDIKKLINPIYRRVMLMVSRARIVKTDDKQTAQLTLFDEEVRDEVEIIQDYGFASRPLDNAEAVVIAVGGNRDHLMVINTGDKQYIIPLEKGEAAIYTDEGDKIHLKRGNCIEIVSKQIKITTDSFEVQ